MSEYLSFYVQRYFMSYLMKQHNYVVRTGPHNAPIQSTERLLVRGLLGRYGNRKDT